MSFRKLDLASVVRFNSKNSSYLLDCYEEYVEQCIQAEASKPHTKTFAPSQFACDRLSWFRLRGVEPDVSNRVDAQLAFSADIGTVCHEILQRLLSNMLGESWISVENYLNDHPIPYEYTLEVKDIGLETFITIVNPPVRFACDGIILLDGRYYILEIKTCDYSSWVKLQEPKSRHIDQVKCYSSLLNIPDVMFLYQDRLYGQIKLYELHFKEYELSSVIDRMNNVLESVEYGIAPEGLKNDSFWCNSNVCPYFKKCKEYGR